MSINKILLNGKTANGLDLEVNSISTSIGSGSIFRGDLTVLRQSDLQGSVTCESNLTVVGNTTLYGNLNFGNPPRQVILDGILPIASQGFIPQDGHISNAQSYDQNYQFYGNTLQIQGHFLGQLPSPTLSKYFTVSFTLPPGFTVSGSFTNRYVSAVGNGFNLSVLSNSQPYVLGGCGINTATQYTMVFISGDGNGPRVIQNNMMFSYNITFDNVTKN